MEIAYPEGGIALKQTIQLGKRIIRMDFGFIAILLLLFATSCFALYNAFNLISVGSGVYYLNRQIMWYGISFLVMAVICHFSNRELFKYVDTIYKVLLAILIYHVCSRFLDRLIGHSLPLAGNINGAYSWLSIPFLGSFQASEFMKVILIIKTSMTISHFQKIHPDPTPKDDMRLFIEIIRWCLLPLILILLQPDTGVCMMIGFTLLILVMCSGIRKQYCIAIFAIIAFAIGLFAVLYLYYPSVLSAVTSQYQLNRIEAWLHPDDYILGSSNQLYTALLSLGSAGLTGHGMQANIIAIPEAHTDFIFAAFGQCFGLIGTVFILVVCALLDLYLCKMAYNTKKKTDRLIIIGTIAMLFYQQAQNISMIVGLLPITGITLPLISYGGSSTLSYFILVGLIMNMSPASKTHIRLKNPVVEVEKRIRRSQRNKALAIENNQNQVSEQKGDNKGFSHRIRSGIKTINLKTHIRSRAVNPDLEIESQDSMKKEKKEKKDTKFSRFKNRLTKKKAETTKQEEPVKKAVFFSIDSVTKSDPDPIVNTHPKTELEENQELFSNIPDQLDIMKGVAISTPNHLNDLIHIVDGEENDENGDFINNRDNFEMTDLFESVRAIQKDQPEFKIKTSDHTIEQEDQFSFQTQKNTKMRDQD